MSKGDDTRRAILAEALDLTSEVGLEGLTIGVLAKLVGMSKSGLYAHFASKEELQVAVLEAAAGLFREQVFEPAKRQPRGLPRIQALFDRWLDWSATVLSGGCPFIAASTEFDDRPGPVRAALVLQLGQVTAMMSHAAALAVEEGHFDPDLDPGQFAFEVWGLVLSAHHTHRLMGKRDARESARRAFTRLIAAAQQPQPQPAPPSPA